MAACVDVWVIPGCCLSRKLSFSGNSDISVQIIYSYRGTKLSLRSQCLHYTSCMLTSFVLLLYLTAGKTAAQIISATGVAVSVPAPAIQTEEGEKKSSEHDEEKQNPLASSAWILTSVSVFKGAILCAFCRRNSFHHLLIDV